MLVHSKSHSNKSAHLGCSELIPGQKFFSFFVANKRRVNLGLLLTSSYFPNFRRMRLKQKEAEMITIVPPVWGLSPSSGIHLNISGDSITVRNDLLPSILEDSTSSNGHVACSTSLWEVILPSLTDIKLGLLACFLWYIQAGTLRTTIWLYFYFFFFFCKIEIGDPQVSEWEYRWSRATTRMWHEQKTILCYCTIEVPSNKSNSFLSSPSLFLSLSFFCLPSIFPRRWLHQVSIPITGRILTNYHVINIFYLIHN